MTEYLSDRSDAILLDIEGTTTPVEYVFGVLFPFAKVHGETFLQTYGRDLAVQNDLKLLRQEYERDRDRGISVPEWNENSPTGAIPYLHYLIEIDRKSTGLKSLQGKIWEQGYRNGTLRSHIFSDVKPAFARWTSLSKQLFIFSSGSVQAQQLLFRYSEQGDLTDFLSGYFDTEIGSKKEADSYRKIAQILKMSGDRILFISDVTEELKAAQSAGMQTLFSFRPGNHSSDSQGFEVVTSFDCV
ncbi:MAG: acireductone synthase [Hydrococcus sp. RM1_1_31]|nr:acireductone synthase [Hydrococcus sp. RM1_1_31]